ncbi:MAG TPA: hypothetical protein PKM57_02190 [Kiritimatiellia bacterium]|nr:hypothetical protein [Kiritimatiellia bacterium]HPS08360.1 hypothetical protein [Kiritimatiellia bacterium]
MKSCLLPWLFSLFAVSCHAVESLPLAVYTPETSKLFRKYVEPASGVVSYILETRVAANQQSLYFTQKSMTEDGRFIVFDVSGGDRRNQKTFALADLLKDEVRPLEIRGSIPFLDTESALLYWFESGGFYKLNLRADAPAKEKLCEIPAQLKAEGTNVSGYATHVTLTPDRAQVFMDARVDDRFIQGMLDIKTGRFEKWGEESVCVNHGQVNPVNGRLALCAHETRWTGTDKVEHRIQNIDGVYPRLLLVEPNGKRRVVPPMNNYATHEYWADDGLGFYYCSHGKEYGVIYYDLATGQQRRIAPVHAAHATMTRDRRYFTYDNSVGPWYRGCAWQVGFYNAETKKEVFLYAERPAFTTKDKPSKLHPDPHPQFVCGDKYIICTINRGDGRMDLSVTPVAPLAEKTR